MSPIWTIQVEKTCKDTQKLLDQASSVSLPRTGVIRKTKLLGTNPVGLPKTKCQKDIQNLPERGE